jgi:membrane-associated HD superfamily phosphohydrolase
MLPISFVNVPRLEPGDVSPVDIRSPISVEAENKKATEKVKEKARKSIKPVFVYSPDVEKKVDTLTEGLKIASPEEKKLIRKLLFSYYKKGILSETPEGYGKIVVITPEGKTEKKTEDFLTREKLKDQ